MDGWPEDRRSGRRWRRRDRAQVLPPGGAGQPVTIGRRPPPPGLAWCVDYAWWVRWDVPRPQVQEVIPRPVVHISLPLPLDDRGRGTDEEPTVTGVPTRLFAQKVDGAGRTVAVAFRPGGFRPFVDRPLRQLVDVRVPLRQLPGIGRLDLAGVVPSLDDEAAAEALLAAIGRLAPEPDPAAEDIADLVERAERDRAIVRPTQLAELAGVSLRTLQRRFADYVGVSPGWVVRRHRLLDVAEASHTEEGVDWAGLASELGYSDQSHLIRHFRTLIGEPPEQHRRSATAGTGPPASPTPR